MYFLCSKCSGRAITVPQIRRVAGDEFATQLLRKINTCTQIGERCCPFCNRRMRSFQIDDPGIELDACHACNLVWFDPQEFESIPEPVAETPHELPLRSREALAIYQAQQIGERAREEDPTPESGWKAIPAFFGLPVELESDSFSGWPVATFSLAGLIVMASLWGFANGQTAIEQFGFIPQKAWRYGGLTMLTSFFLHGGLVHLGSNLYFLLLFGAHVEDYLGKWRFASLTMLAALTGDLLHLLIQPDSKIPSVGASGGIAGVIAFYALEFPRSRLGFLMYFRWVQLPAWGVFVFWLFLQFIGAIKQVSGFSGVNSLAHLGGVVLGFVAWLVWKERTSGLKPEPSPSV